MGAYQGFSAGGETIGGKDAEERFVEGEDEDGDGARAREVSARDGGEVQTTRARTQRRSMPLVARCANSMRVAMAG